MNRLKIGAAGFAVTLLAAPFLMADFGTNAAYAQTCEPTLDTLPQCVTHHYENGQIHSKAVYKLLLFKANAAIYAHDHGNDEAAIKILKLFIKQVKAFTPKLIDPEAADHMTHHANSAIEQLQS
jgi:hypothetical protein